MDQIPSTVESRYARKSWWKSIGVEPVMFLYMMAFMLTSVVEEAFFVYKACSVNLGYSDDVCNRLTAPENKHYQKEVQLKVSTFHQYENFASHLVPIVLAFFLGPWSDKVGRKIPLILGLFGNFIYSTMIVVNASFHWPVEVILLSASLPCALTGGNLTVFMASFSYLADTTNQKQRTLRTTLLEVTYLFPMPVGVALGSYLFTSVLDHSYAKMFMINASLLLLAIIYTCIFIERKTNRGSDESANENNRKCLCVWELINIAHVVHTVNALLKRREGLRRMILIFTLIAMAFYTFQRDEKHMVYLYTQMKFKWDVPTFSKFRTFQSSFFVLGLLIGVPIMERCFGFRDNVIIMVGATAHFITRVIFSVAEASYLFYLGSVIASLGPIVAPVLRSITSKLVPASDRGKIFAVLSAADLSVPLLSGVIYTQVYNNFFDSFPQSIFVVTAVSQLFVFCIALTMDVLTKRKNISQAYDRKEDDEISDGSSS